MSHYPTSAELQDFRRAIWPYPDLVEPAHGGAYGHEVREGIGAISAGKNWGVMYPDSTLPGEARREAAAMRSRAYDAAICPVCGTADISDGPGCDCYGTGSLVHGPDGLTCYLCDKLHRHAADCDWNLERV